LYEEALALEEGTQIAANGALVALSGDKTGRCPKDKRIVESSPSMDDVWWGDINIPMTPAVFAQTRRRAVEYLRERRRVYVIDGYAGWDPDHQLKIRVICERAYHALFMHNMLIRLSREELAGYGDPDFVVLNAGRHTADPRLPGVESRTSVTLNFEEGESVILGTEYAGEMKKGVFTLMNYLMPKRGVLSMHCSANQGANGDVTVFFGLSGTGKTTLSADPHRALIGDDEHCWTPRGIFNIEGGCYAKTINLSAAAEPEIHQAIRFGSVLENVVLNPETREVDFADTSVTTNTRGAYPLDYIRNARLPALAGHPRNVIFLTCDAFGVLPPLSRLTAGQAMYHFISGYTAKVAGTEVGVTDPEATFSACFGAPFLVWHPTKYAEMLAENIRRHKVSVWLLNTGWSGGQFGKGKRIRLAFTRAMIDAIHDGSLKNTECKRDEVFGLAIPVEIPNVPTEILRPRDTWADQSAYDRAARRLAALFNENFKAFESVAGREIREAAPRG
jgi:phosphoenolpyruvate carboxykinase (ATP)